MRVLLDTNVLISAILFGGVSRGLLRRAVEGRIRLVTSARLLDELEEVLRGKFAFSYAAAAETRSELEVLAEVVEPAEIPKICRDPDDDEVLAAATAAAAAAIVSGDGDLLDLGSYRGIEIVTPAAFAERLRAEEG